MYDKNFLILVVICSVHFSCLRISPSLLRRLPFYLPFKKYVMLLGLCGGTQVASEYDRFQRSGRLLENHFEGVALKMFKISIFTNPPISVFLILSRLSFYNWNQISQIAANWFCWAKLWYWLSWQYDPCQRKALYFRNENDIMSCMIGVQFLLLFDDGGGVKIYQNLHDEISLYSIRNRSKIKTMTEALS